MKAQTAFWPLLKNELALNRRGDATGTAFILLMLLIYWFGIGVFPLLALYGNDLARGRLDELFVLFDAGFLPIFAFVFLCVLTAGITYATVPSFLDRLPSGNSVGPGAFEFYFTCVMDRRILLRARTTALFIFILTPFLLNVGVSVFTPEISFGRASAELMQRQHPGTFPFIPHGAVAYTAWLAWSAMLAFLVLQTYGTWIARRVKPNDWRTAILPGVPILVLLVLMILGARGYLGARINVYENSFLFFSAHPLALVTALAALAAVVQIWCERRFSKLEIL